MDKYLLFGGSFDPIHHGHLIMARTAIEHLDMDKVVFIPSGDHPVKKNTADYEKRFKMCQKAICTNDKFEVSDIEKDSKTKTYTIDTVKKYKEKWKDRDIYWYIGTDNLMSLSSWHEIDQLMNECKFVVGSRSSSNSDYFHLLSLCKKITQIIKLDENKSRDYFEPLVNVCIEISSTEIKNRLKNNLSIKYLTPESIIKYIKTQKIYEGIK